MADIAALVSWQKATTKFVRFFAVFAIVGALVLVLTATLATQPNPQLPGSR